jgi:hypothetical protein
MRFSFVKPAIGIPSFFLTDFIDASPSNLLWIIKFNGFFSEVRPNTQKNYPSIHWW